MSLRASFAPFGEETPICVMARGILERLLDPRRLDRLFEATAQQQDTRDLLFSTAVELRAQVVLNLKPSVHAAYKAMADRIPVSDQAVYDKLQHLELRVSAALVRDSAQRAAPLLHALRANWAPWLKGSHTKILDGNHLEATEHRIAETRTTWAAPLPGKSLVVLDQPTQTITDILLTEDGQAQERSLLGEVFGLIQPWDLGLADRKFCTLHFLFTSAAKGAAFVIRQPGCLKGPLLGKRRAKGRCATGLVDEQRLQLEDADGKVLIVRRVTVALDQPTPDGDTEIHILTNLPGPPAPAAQVAELYRRRWTIEGLFLEVERTLACEIKTLAYPKAALFALCGGFLAANAVAVVKAALRAAHGEKKALSLSTYYLTLEIRETYRGMMLAIPARHWTVFGRMQDAPLAPLLCALARKMNLTRYTKSPRGPKKKPPKRRRYQHGEQIATAKLLAARK